MRPWQRQGMDTKLHHGHVFCLAAAYPARAAVMAVPRHQNSRRRWHYRAPRGSKCPWVALGRAVPVCSKTTRHQGVRHNAPLWGKPRPVDLNDAQLAPALLGGTQGERTRSEDT